MNTDTHRLAAMLSGKDRGWSDATSAKVALAMHPLDDSARPRTRAFEKVARRQSRKVAWGVRRAGDLMAEAHAVVALNVFRDAAIKNAEPHYSTRYDKVLGRSTEEA